MKDPKTGHDLWYLTPKPGGGYESKPYLRTPAHEGAARFSPDGQFLAYVSSESRRAEVYIRHFPGESGVRPNGCQQPHDWQIILHREPASATRPGLSPNCRADRTATVVSCQSIRYQAARHSTRTALLRLRRLPGAAFRGRCSRYYTIR